MGSSLRAGPRPGRPGLPIPPCPSNKFTRPPRPKLQTFLNSGMPLDSSTFLRQRAIWRPESICGGGAALGNPLFQRRRICAAGGAAALSNGVTLPCCSLPSFNHWVGHGRHDSLRIEPPQGRFSYCERFLDSCPLLAFVIFVT